MSTSGTAPQNSKPTKSLFCNQQHAKHREVLFASHTSKLPVRCFLRNPGAKPIIPMSKVQHGTHCRMPKCHLTSDPYSVPGTLVSGLRCKLVAMRQVVAKLSETIIPDPDPEANVIQPFPQCCGPIGAADRLSSVGQCVAEGYTPPT